MPDADGDATSLEMLADYECPECGPCVQDPPDPMYPRLTEDEALAVLGGDDNGFVRCPNDWCDEELELTSAAAAALRAMAVERMPGLAQLIAEAVGTEEEWE